MDVNAYAYRIYAAQGAPFRKRGCPLCYTYIYNGGVGFYHALTTIGFPRTATSKSKQVIELLRRFLLIVDMNNEN